MQTVVVSGGSGFIGSRLVERLTDIGSRVAILDIEPPARDLGVTFFKTEKNPSAQHIHELASEIEQCLGPVSGLINCSSSMPSDLNSYHDEMFEYKLKAWNEVLLGNLTNVFLLCREFSRRMKDRRSGSIVNFASVYGADFGPDLRIYSQIREGIKMTTPIPYSTSKGAIIAFTRHLAMVLGTDGVRVNAVSPGGVYNGQDSEFVKLYSNRVPMGRMAEVDEIIGLPIFLLSNEASYITGQNFYIDGGLSAW